MEGDRDTRVTQDSRRDCCNPNCDVINLSLNSAKEKAAPSAYAGPVLEYT